MARAISEVLFESGNGLSKEPSPFTQEEIEQIYGVSLSISIFRFDLFIEVYTQPGPLWTFLAANFYAESDRSHSLGWNPKGTKADFLSDVREETKAFLTEST